MNTRCRTIFVVRDILTCAFVNYNAPRAAEYRAVGCGAWMSGCAGEVAGCVRVWCGVVGWGPPACVTASEGPREGRRAGKRGGLIDDAA